ncbi:MAG: hypothetical protein Q4A15_00325 [Prevotellaceae bacterium]|nr:hypothetical protein [Prevotellaceae bacterium]
MFVDTHSKESMENSVCQIFQMHPLELREQLLLIDRPAGDDDDYKSKLDLFVAENATVYPDEILLFHLTRRLYGTEDEIEGRNLADLLLSDNPFSSFLRDCGIGFIKGEQHIDVIYKDKIVDWDKCWHGNFDYMKSRLGYFKGREDFCFNGFAMKDLLYRNDYARALQFTPEFLENLTACLKCENVARKYMERSEYFCYEYKLPISAVMFDDHDKYSDTLKQRYLLSCVLQRIYQYQTSKLKSMTDIDNPILRLPDDYTIPSKYYIGREKIESEMLCY